MRPLECIWFTSVGCRGEGTVDHSGLVTSLKQGAFSKTENQTFRLKQQKVAKATGLNTGPAWIEQPHASLFCFPYLFLKLWWHKCKGKCKGFTSTWMPVSLLLSLNLQAMRSVKSAACPYLKDVNMPPLDTIQDRDDTCITKLNYYGVLSTFCRGPVWLVLNSVQPHCVEGDIN